MNVQEIRDWYRVRPGYWFRPKRYGYGAVPVTWQGWLASFAVIPLTLAIARLSAVVSPAWIVLMVPLIMGFVWLCWARTDGEWRWRWGGEDA